MMNPAERKKLSGEVFARTGIPVDPGDPIFAVVDLALLGVDARKTEIEKLLVEFATRIKHDEEYATRKFDSQVGTIVNATNGAKAALGELAKNSEKYANEYQKSAAEKEAKSVVKFIDAEVEKILGGAINLGREDLISKLNTAAENLHKKAEDTEKKFSALYEEVKSNRLHNLLKTAAIAISCSIVVVFGARLSGAFEHRPSDTELREIAVGRAILANWQNLSASDRQRINEMTTRPQK
jgi:hypothetical protein